MTKETLKEAINLESLIEHTERQLRDVEEALFNTRDLEETYEDNSLRFGSNDQMFKFKRQDIFVSKSQIVARLDDKKQFCKMN